MALPCSCYSCWATPTFLSALPFTRGIEKEPVSLSALRCLLLAFDLCWATHTFQSALSSTRGIEPVGHSPHCAAVFLLLVRVGKEPAVNSPHGAAVSLPLACVWQLQPFCRPYLPQVALRSKCIICICCVYHEYGDTHSLFATVVHEEPRPHRVSAGGGKPWKDHRRPRAGAAVRLEMLQKAKGRGSFTRKIIRRKT